MNTIPTLLSHKSRVQREMRTPVEPTLLFLSVLFASSISMAAQQAVDENAVDDSTFDQQPIVFSHFQALDVIAEDFDGNGVQDLVIGGQNGQELQAFSLQVIYMKLNQGVVVIDHAQILNPVPAIGYDTDPIYDLDVGDIDGVNGPDIVVGIFENNNSLDRIYLNNGVAGSNFGVETFIPKPAGPAGSTGGLELVDIDGNDKLDLVSVGNYGLHYYKGTGNGTFQFKKTYMASSGLTARGLETGDVDGDGDEDVVTASSEVVTVLRNRRTPHMVPLDYADNPLTVVTQSNSLVANFPPAMKTPQSTATCSAGTQLLGLTIIGTFSCDLADFDADGDLDVVVANSVDSNVLYLNYGVGDGTGFFGSKNTDPTPSSHSDADGIPAIAFPTLTPDWTGSSAVLDLILYGQSPVTACNGSAVVYHIPGKRIDSTTGVESEDVNGDGRPDVVFSNRNDIEDVMYKRCSCPAAPDCPGAPSCPAPDYDFLSQTYDYLFLNNSSFDGSGNYLWPFDAVERIGLPDDGTAYGQFADLNPPTLPDGDDRPDWLDANWRNATPADGGLQHVYFGNRLVSRTWVALNQGSPPNPIPFDLDLSLSNSDVGKTYVLFASCSGASSPPTPYMGFNVPLASAVPVTGSSGTVTNRHFQLTGSVSSPCGGTPCELFFTVFLISGTSGKATNITRTPVKCP